MTIRKLYILFVLVFSPSCFIAQNYTQWVNPFIGSSNFGTTNPGAQVPQGMVSVVPFNVNKSDENKWSKDERWWSTPYSSDNYLFTGFSHANLSGVGCPELGVVIVMPTTGELDASLADYGSTMSQQVAHPGYYSCFLDEYNIKTEVTATPRSGLSQFTYPAGKSNIMIDLGNGLTNETGGSVRCVSSREVEGWRMTGNFCYHANSERAVYFVARVSKEPSSFGAWKKMPKMGAESSWSSSSDKIKYYESSHQPIAGDSVGAYFTFETEANEEVMIQVGLSYVSIANARENLNAEQDGFQFDTTKNAALHQWEETLSKVKVEGGTVDQKKIFYTALYHLHIHPNIISDVNGMYPAMDSHQVLRKPDGSERYSVFSLWDTYRTYHPLMTLLYPELQNDFVKSMIEMYRESGWLPKWELNGRETYTMNGDPSIVVISDTYLKGVKDYDIAEAYEGMLKNATTPGQYNKVRGENDFYWSNGYVPLRTEFDHSTSDALEYYIADWHLGQLAKNLGKSEDYHKFNSQSLNYKTYFDTETFGMIRPKYPNGKFIDPFDPLQGVNFEPVPGFHEGNAWQYTFCAPHDISGLIKLMGGQQKFVEKLQLVFDKNYFDMGNEPDIHYPYLFNYVKGEEWRAQKSVKNLLEKHFENKAAGLPGNDDCGTMSAWAVFSMMGIYPVLPGSAEYTIVQPVFDKITIDISDEYYSGNFLVIESRGCGDSIKKIKWNGSNLNSFFINHLDLVDGGKLEILK